MTQKSAPGSRKDGSSRSNFRYSSPETRWRRSPLMSRQSNTINPLSVIARSLCSSASQVAESSAMVSSTGAEGTTTSPPPIAISTAFCAEPLKKQTPRMRW